MRCGAIATVPDGAYEILQDAFLLLQGANVTRVEVKRLEKLHRKMVASGKDADDTIPDDVIDAISAVKPEIGAAIKLVKSGNGKWAVGLMVMSLLLARCGGGGDITFDFSQEVTVNQVVNKPTRVEDTNIFYPHDPKKTCPSGP